MGVFMEIKKLLEQILAELKTLNGYAAQSQANAQEALKANREQVSQAISALGGIIPPSLRNIMEKTTKGGGA